jgi:hypothetical protein
MLPAVKKYQKVVRLCFLKKSHAKRRLKERSEGYRQMLNFEMICQNSSLRAFLARKKKSTLHLFEYEKETNRGEPR